MTLVCFLSAAQGRIPETTLACMRLLRQKLPEANISVEVEKPGREGLSQLAQEADVVFYSRAWAEVRIPSLITRSLDNLYSVPPSSSHLFLPLLCPRLTETGCLEQPCS